MNKIFSEQTEEEQKARKTIMEVTYLSLFVFLLLIMILTRSSRLASTAQAVSFVAQGLIAIAALTSFIFSRHGYTVVGAYFLPCGIMLLTVILINVTGVGSINALFFVTVIVIAGMTAGIRGVVIFGALSIVSAIGLYFAQNYGLLANKSPVSMITPAITIAHILGDSLILIFLIRIFNKNPFTAAGDLGVGLGAVIMGGVLRLTNYPIMFLCLALIAAMSLGYFHHFMKQKGKSC